MTYEITVNCNGFLMINVQVLLKLALDGNVQVPEFIWTVVAVSSTCEKSGESFVSTTVSHTLPPHIKIQAQFTHNTFLL
jgi:hypothetical protein